MTIASAGLAAGFDPVPLLKPGRKWIGWIGPVISIAVLATIFDQVGRIDVYATMHHFPDSPTFWLLFCASYCATPVAEWILFKRLWNIPAAGFVALMRKQVSNQLLLGYLGEVYFYGWARRRGKMTTAPFGTIRDVAILSALCGNAASLVTLPIAAILVHAMHLGVDDRLLYLSFGVIVLSSAIALLAAPRLFSLSGQQIRFVVGVHVIRIVANLMLASLLWFLVLPKVWLGWWLLLAAIRQCVSRLPLIPNKDVVFVAIAEFFLGRHAEITAMLAMITGATLMVHISIGAFMGVGALIDREQAE